MALSTLMPHTGEKEFNNKFPPVHYPPFMVGYIGRPAFSLRQAPTIKDTFGSMFVNCINKAALLNVGNCYIWCYNKLSLSNLIKS